MSAESNGNSPAFAGGVYKGLTKKEFFTACALQGLLSNPNLATRLSPNNLSTIAEEAVEQADNVLKVLDKTI